MVPPPTAHYISISVISASAKCGMCFDAPRNLQCNIIIIIIPAAQSLLPLLPVLLIIIILFICGIAHY